MKNILTAGTLFAALCSTAQAELPPSVYENAQKAAPEKLEIFVVNVNSTSRGMWPSTTHLEHRVLAVVTVVHRTKSGLKPNDSITISYDIQNRAEGWVGPSDPLVAQAGQRYTAYLAAGDSEHVYNLAARGKSFVRLRAN